MSQWDGSGIDPWLPDRIAAESRLAEAERRMYDTWWGSFSRWIVGVKRGVFTQGGRVDPQAVWSQVPAWAEHMDAMVAGPVTDVVGDAYRELFGEGYRFDARPSVTSYLASVRNRMVRTPEEVFDVIATTVARGAGAGQSIKDVAREVDQVLTGTGTQRWRNRAVTVARTETIGALNFGRTDAFGQISEELGQPMEQMWLATVDRRTREDHVAADGQRQLVGVMFTVGGWPLRYPGDPEGPAEQVINCRCTTLLLKPGENVSMVGRGWQDAGEVWQQYQGAATKTTKAAKTPKATKAKTTRKPPAKAAPAKAPAQPPAKVTPVKAGPSNPAVLGGGDTSHTRRDWWETLKADTGPDKYVPVVNLHLPAGNGEFYVIGSGRAYRVNGITYLFEDGALGRSAETTLAELRAFHASLPAEAAEYQRGFALLKGRNPLDAFWGREYGISGFTSAATAGHGATNLWQAYYKSATSGGLTHSLSHEFGHNVANAVRRLGLDDHGELWRESVGRDATHSRVGLQFQAFERGRHSITLTANHGKPYPLGVTSYGKSSVMEDYAESVDLYLAGPIGTGIIGGRRVTVYFRDLFPARAALLDRVFPSVARTQKAAIKGR